MHVPLHVPSVGDSDLVHNPAGLIPFSVGWDDDVWNLFLVFSFLGWRTLLCFFTASSLAVDFFLGSTSSLVTLFLQLLPLSRLHRFAVVKESSSSLMFVVVSSVPSDSMTMSSSHELSRFSGPSGGIRRRS